MAETALRVSYANWCTAHSLGTAHCCVHSFSVGAYFLSLSMDGFYELYDQLSLTFGTVSLCLLLGVELVLVIVSMYLALVARSQHALTLFFPLTLAPIFAGALNTFLTLSSTITFLQSNEANATQVQDTMIVVGMSAVPILFGVVVAIPSCLVVAFGRVWIMWNANRKPKAQRIDQQNTESARSRASAASASDADNYLTELARSHRR